MYEKLLLSNKGGIITGAQLCEQDNCAVLAIGLGGTGCDCLRNLKAKVFNRVQPDDASSEIPEYKHIKFLAVDTDKEGFKKANDEKSSIEKINVDTEFFDLSYQGNINDFFRNNAYTLSTKDEYKEWLLYDRIRVEDAKAGACGVRQLGRYLLMERANAFISGVRDRISEAKRGLRNPKVYVHIFSGLGGGTGAGTFLDACYLVQKALESEGEKTAYILGYFFLPDVNLEKSGLSDQTKGWIKINGYASLQELDYCMNFERNGDKWSQNYPGIGPIENSAPPVDICHLISSHYSNGDRIPDAYNYAMNVVTDYFMDFLIKSSDEFNMNSHITNYQAVKTLLDKDSGANYEYCLLGASNATLPYKDVLTYLSSYMFGAMSGMRNNNAVTGDCERFARANGITYDALFNAATREVNLGFPDPEFNAGEAFGDNDLVTRHFSDHRTTAVGKATANLTQMGRDIGRLDTINADGAAGAGRSGDAGSSTVTKIFYALNTLVEDPEKGPYYASALLNGTSGTDLVSLINGHVETVTGRINQLEFNLPDFERRRTAAAEAFVNSNVVNRGGKYKKFVDTTRALAKQYAEREILYAFRDFLRTLKDQLTSLSNTYYRKYCAVVTNLCETFEANKKYLEELKKDDKGFEYPIASITDENLRAALDNYLADSFDVPSETKKFHQYMLKPEGYRAWKDNRENDIARYISSYFSGIFSEYTNKGMSQYLYEKYGTESPEQIIQNVRDDIMENLNQNSKPLFWSSTIYNIDAASKIGYTTTPYTCQEVTSAAAKLQLANSELKVRGSDAKDRITIMRCLVGAPLYGYSPITSYEVTSISDNTLIGKHLYEGRTYIDENGNTRTGRDWRKLPSPIPLRYMNSNNSSVLVEIAKKRAALYEEAEELGIIVKNGADDYSVRIIDDEFINSIEQTVAAVLNSGNKEAMINAQNTIKQMKETIRYSAISYLIPNDARNGDAPVSEPVKKLVRIDHFASMPVICAKVEAEIEKLKKIDQYIADLEPKVDRDFEDYANALFTGAITINGIMLTYTDDFFNEVKLSAPNMPMGGMRLYQAFVNFKELDDGTKSKLNAISEKRNAMEEGMDVIIAACTNVNAQFAQNQIAMVLKMASSTFPAIAGEIRDFYANLQTKFTNYLMTYGITL